MRIARLAALGDDDALICLWNRHQSALRCWLGQRLCRRIRVQHSLDDILQDVYIGLLRSLRTTKRLRYDQPGTVR